MKNKLGKILAAMAMVPCMWFAAGCGENPPPASVGNSSTLAASNSSVSQPKYDHVQGLNRISVTDDDFYGEFLGNIDDLVELGVGYYGVYSDGVLYDYEGGLIDYEKITWNIGSDITEFLYNFDELSSTKILTKNSNNELIAYSYYDDYDLETDSDERKFSQFKLKTTPDQLICARGDHYGVMHIYSNVNGEIMYEQINLESETSSGLIPLYIEITENDIVKQVQPVSLSELTAQDYGLMAKLENGDCVIIDEDEICFKTPERAVVKPSGVGFKLKNISKCYYSVIFWDYVVAIEGDNNHLYYYSGESEDYSSIDNWTQEATKIVLPTGYTISDIEDVFFSIQTVFKFSDGKYYTLNRRNIFDAPVGAVVNMVENLPLTQIDSQCNIVRLFTSAYMPFFSEYVYYLMDDGYIYFLM